MSLAFPAALAWTLLAIPIVVFYILKIRLRRVPVSTTLFWQQIFDEKQPRSIWQHLRHLVSLLFQLALLLLLVFALTEPYFRSQLLTAERVILVVDNSASMNATDAEPTRLHAAREIGHDAIARLRLLDEMTIVAAGTEPQVVCGLTGHQRTLCDALDAIAPSDGPTRVREAIELARRLVSDAEHARVIVLTDGCFADAEEMPDAENLEVHIVGQRTSNVGITNFQVRRSLTDPVGYEILAEVLNASDEEVQCRLELDLNDLPVDVLPLKLAGGETWSRTFEKTSTDGGRLVARLTHEDALAADNTAWALLPKRDLQRVLLVGEPSLFLQKALEASPLVQLTTVEEIPKQVPDGAVLVLHRTVPQKLPPGAVFVIDPASSSDAWELGGKLENPVVAEQDKDSPLMQHVRLDQVLLPDARKLTIHGEPKVLVAGLNKEPLLAAINRDAGKLLVLTVNLSEGDLAFRTAFPIFVTNALNWFAGTSGELRESVAAGSVTEVQLRPDQQTSPGNTSHVLRAPNGATVELPASQSKPTIGPLDQRGIWTIASATEADAPPVVELACNVASREETNLRMPDSLLTLQANGAMGTSLLTKPVWFYLILLAWILLVVEWFLYQRRWIS